MVLDKKFSIIFNVSSTCLLGCRGGPSIPQPLELDPIDIGAHTCYKCTIYFNNGNKNFMNDNVDDAITIYNGAESSICIGDFEKL